MVSAWPEPPAARPAEPPVGVCDGWDIFAFGTSEPQPRREADTRRCGIWAAHVLSAVAQLGVPVFVYVPSEQMTVILSRRSAMLSALPV
jgi:hypothetical protein